MKHSYFFAVGISLLFVAAPLQDESISRYYKGYRRRLFVGKSYGKFRRCLGKSNFGRRDLDWAGTYKPTQLIKSSKKNSRHFPLKDGVSLYGGFAGTEKSKEERMKVEDGEAYDYVNTTILSADDDVPDEWVREANPTNPYMYGGRLITT